MNILYLKYKFNHYEITTTQYYIMYLPNFLNHYFNLLISITTNIRTTNLNVIPRRLYTIIVVFYKNYIIIRL